MCMKVLFLDNSPSLYQPHDHKKLWWPGGFSVIREILILHVWEVTIQRESYPGFGWGYPGWGCGLVDWDSSGVHWDPDLVPISFTVDHVQHKGSHDAGCDIWNLSNFRIMGKLSSAFLIGYFDIAFLFSPLFTPQYEQVLCSFHGELFCSFDSTASCLWKIAS